MAEAEAITCCALKNSEHLQTTVPHSSCAPSQNCPHILGLDYNDACSSKNEGLSWISRKNKRLEGEIKWRFGDECSRLSVQL